MDPIFVVLELQTNPDGTLGNFIFSYTDQNEAWAKYHAILAAAATSQLPIHSAVILDNYGSRIDGKPFIHEAPVAAE